MVTALHFEWQMLRGYIKSHGAYGLVAYLGTWFSFRRVWLAPGVAILVARSNRLSDMEAAQAAYRELQRRARLDALRGRP
jgi:hypothetical protein